MATYDELQATSSEDVISDVFRSAGSSSQQRPKCKSPPPFSLRLSADERAHLKSQAGNKPLGAFIRDKLLGDSAEKRRKVRRPGRNHETLALLLSELARSRLSASLGELAHAASIGTLDVTPETIDNINQACRDIADIRSRLIAGLGVKVEGGG